jgi:hypothetical protein
MNIDLRKCEIGQKLLLRNYEIATYLGTSEFSDYPHRIRYPNGGEGTRCDDGSTYRFRKLPDDPDVVEIYPMLTPKPENRRGMPANLIVVREYEVYILAGATGEWYLHSTAHKTREDARKEVRELRKRHSGTKFKVAICKVTTKIERTKA